MSGEHGVRIARGGPATLRRLLALSRPRFWVYLLGPWAIGIVAASGDPPDPRLLVLGLWCTLPANLLIYGVNDLYDRPSDRINGKKGSYEALLDPSEDRTLVVAILATNLPFLALLPFLPLAAIAWAAVLLVLGVGYSAPPLRFKARPFLDSASNLLYAVPGLVAFTTATSATPSPALVVAAALWCAAMHAFSAVPDIDADRSAGVPTIATRLGARGTLVVCLVLWLVAAALVVPALPVFALAAGLAYLLLGVASLRAVGGARPSLFALYRIFPVVNTVVGAGLFFSIFWLRAPLLR
ncbi:prenyltransferase [Amnibacterium sp. CER49]|uniref:prenyltransferase n=1 Tax=Amnibacterium sp. CER49 TaxID=3039161 RepID=UPI00244A4A21|nr:prenyltransferase [Amnibacterium sp. CER49]MDH2442503.1 prenyltransferase [Amnibacterium sp. CER49]